MRTPSASSYRGRTLSSTFIPTKAAVTTLRFSPTDCRGASCRLKSSLRSASERQSNRRTEDAECSVSMWNHSRHTGSRWSQLRPFPKVQMETVE